MRDMKRAVVGIAAIGLAALLVSSCGFLLPQRGHENPLDPASPVALIVGFAAETTAIDATAGTASIKLTWTQPAERAPATVLIVRNDAAQPRSRDDGEAATTEAAALEYADADVVPGKVYHYAAWCTDDAGETWVGPANAQASTVQVAALADFAAVATAADTVQLTWTVPATDVPAGMIVVRKEGSAPANREDGVPVPVTLGNEITTDLVAANKVYNYAAWTYDAARLRFAGPASATASTLVPSPVASLVATATGETTVEVAWSAPTAGNIPAGIRLVRKAGAAPSNPLDGTELTVTLADGEYTDEGVTTSTIYYYAAWSLDATGHIPSTPVFDEADTHISYLPLTPASVDGSLWETLPSSFEGSNNVIYVGNQAGNHYLGLLTFAGVPPQVLGANLVLYTYGDVYVGYTVSAQPVATGWLPTSVTYSDAVLSGFVGSGAQAAIAVSGTDRVLSVDVTSAVAGWASGNLDNNGFLLSRVDAGNEKIELYASETANVNFRPRLDVLCSEEFH